ncbi:transposase [Salipiger marinus]|uniref:transposase n=1 Tax=Salipiger marinus TaxID=555512 RepID=UPI002C3AEF94|nr:transposase [Salipiger manganoxidans]MEB3421667.1 transposase [Salipiger manganoxidans]
MFAKNSFLTALGVEVFDSGQRRWPEHVKAQAVAETLEPVSGVTARYEIMPSQLTSCRRLAKEGKLVLPAVEIDDAQKTAIQIFVREMRALLADWAAGERP